MRKTPASVAVEKGIEYLSETYPNWWIGIKLSELNIYSPVGHVLAQITGRLSYETKEAMT